jgi:hypothetical protein
MAAGLAASREGSMVASFEKKSQDLEVNEIESGDDEDKSQRDARHMNLQNQELRSEILSTPL